MDALGIHSGADNWNGILPGDLERKQGGKAACVHYETVSIHADPPFYFERTGMSDSHRNCLVAVASRVLNDRSGIATGGLEKNPLVTTINHCVIALEYV